MDKEEEARLLWYIADINFRPAGFAMNYYVAGGAIRDLLLGLPLRDVDYAFAATEEEFIQRNPSARKIQSAPCPVYLLDGQEFALLSQQDVMRDLWRRDFTVNALLLAENGVLRMHPDALEDLQKRRIRPASPSALADDPVRAFRAARLTARLPDFSLHEETLAQMRALAAPSNAASTDGLASAPAGQSAPEEKARSFLDAIPAEQVGNELRKACLAARPGNFLRALRRGDCLAPWFAEFVRADSLPAGPPTYHDGSVFEHTADIMDATAEIARRCGGADSERALSVWMALCHDLGKSATPDDILPHHYGHEERGAAMAERLGLRLRLPGIFVKAGKLAALLHMKAGRYAILRPGTRTDMLMRLHAADLVAPFGWMAAADSARPDLPDLWQRDLERLLAVRLPEHWRDKGELSGIRLRELRCMALSHS